MSICLFVTFHPHSRGVSFELSSGDVKRDVERTPNDEGRLWPSGDYDSFGDGEGDGDGNGGAGWQELAGIRRTQKNIKFCRRVRIC